MILASSVEYLSLSEPSVSIYYMWVISAVLASGWFNIVYNLLVVLKISGPKRILSELFLGLETVNH